MARAQWIPPSLVPVAALCLLLAAPALARSRPQPRFGPAESALQAEFDALVSAVESKRYEDAIKLGKRIVDDHPRHEAAIYAENMVLDSLVALRHWRELDAHMEEFARRFPGGEWSDAWLRLLSDAREMVGRDEERQGNFWECARYLLAAAETAPEHPQHAGRLWDTARCFYKAHRVGHALRARLTLVRDHAQDPLARDAMYLIAENYRQLAYYAKAAEWYENFARDYPRDDRAAPALMLAIRLRVDLIPSAE